MSVYLYVSEHVNISLCVYMYSRGMSEEGKQLIELPKALKEIVKLLKEEGPLTYEELAQKLDKDETTIIRQCQKLIEMEVCVKIEKDGKAAVALAEGIEVDEEGNVYVPSPFEDPEEKLKQLLEEAGVKGRKLKWIMRLVSSTPDALQKPEVLFDILTGAGVKRPLAQQIVRAFFGTEFTPPSPYPMPMYPMPMRTPPYYQYPYYYMPFMPMSPMEKEVLRLESRLERLMEEIKEIKSNRSSPQYPIVRKVRVDEHGNPVEIVEEPVVPGSSRDDTMVTVMKMMMEQRDQMWKMITEVQKTTHEIVEKLSNTMKETMTQFINTLKEIEQQRSKEIMELKVEMEKREKEWQRQYYEEKIEEYKNTIASMQEHFSKELIRLKEEIKKDLEYQEKLKELESRKTTVEKVRDKTLEAIDDLRKDIREFSKVIKDFLESQLKQHASSIVPKVSEEEKKAILKKLRKAVKKEESSAEEEKGSEEASEERKEEEVKLRSVGKGE